MCGGSGDNHNGMEWDKRYYGATKCSLYTLVKKGGLELRIPIEEGELNYLMFLWLFNVF